MLLVNPSSSMVALVTGGARGLGRATAIALAAAGARVVIADVAAEAAATTAAEIGGSHVVCDVRSLEDNLATVAFAKERYGGLDVAVLNAGVLTDCGVEDDFSEDAYRRACAVNLDGVVFGTHACLPALRQRGGGAIVAIASYAGLAPQPPDPIYAATKHAVVGFVRSLAPTLEDSGIRINAVCPSFAESPMLERWRDEITASGIPPIPAEVVAETVLTAATQDRSGECWFVQAGRPAQPFVFRGVPGPRSVNQQ